MEKEESMILGYLKPRVVKFSESVKVIADKGYQGIAKIHDKSETPLKKPQEEKLTNKNRS